MSSFHSQAQLLVSRLEIETLQGARDDSIDRDLSSLRDAWKALSATEREETTGLTSRIAMLGRERPGPGEADLPADIPAGNSQAEVPDPPSSYEEPPMPVEYDEVAEAQRALQGLEGIELDQSVPVRTFEGDPDPDSLLSHMGYDGFRPGQREAVEAALDGRDSLIVMPTGGGKSLCYQLPGLAGTDLTLVVSPLIALMADQVRRLKKEGHPAVMFASGLSDSVATASYNAVRDGSARIAYCSPERFGSSSFLDLLNTRKVDLLAIDEAHCLSEWGHDFRPDYLRLPKVAERLGRPPVMACTATATQQVADEIAQRMGMKDPEQIHSGFDRPNLSFDTVALEGKGSKARKQALLEFGLNDPANRPAIVYCGTRRDTEELGDDLRSSGLSAVSYHAGMQPDDRASAQHRFMEGDADIVVATNAFGMGIDKADVRTVWHWAIPSSVEAYYQEAGRAGRDGEPAKAVLLAMRSDLGRLVRFNERRKVDPNDVVSYIDSIRRMNGGSDGVVIDAPRSDEERIRLAVGERAGALTVDPAPGGRLLVRIVDDFEPGAIPSACRVAEDRGWKAYRAVEAFAFSEELCRRRQLLDHFGDDSPTSPSGRCCDVCDPDGWLPDPASLVVRKSRANPKRGATPVPDLTPEDQEIFEVLRKWRLGAAGDKPAYHVASNRTLSAIATVKPVDEVALLEISGVGPSFMEKHGSAVLRLVSEHT